MATALATVSPVAISTVAMGATTPSSKGTKASRVNYIVGLNSFCGLKAQNKVGSLGFPVCTETSFAKIVSSLRSPRQGKGSSGGALSSTCNATAEIFKIAAIMNGLTLVGVAVGFVLLRIEAFVEESE